MKNTGRSRAQTAMEYLLIISASVMIILSVILIGQGYIGQSSNVAGNQLVVYNVLLNRLEATPAPVPPFPCPKACTNDDDCRNSCPTGYSWKCSPGSYCVFSPTP